MITQLTVYWSCLSQPSHLRGSTQNGDNYLLRNHTSHTLGNFRNVIDTETSWSHNIKITRHGKTKTVRKYSERSGNSPAPDNPSWALADERACKPERVETFMRRPLIMNSLIRASDHSLWSHLRIRECCLQVLYAIKPLWPEGEVSCLSEKRKYAHFINYCHYWRSSSLKVWKLRPSICQRSLEWWEGSLSDDLVVETEFSHQKLQ